MRILGIETSCDETAAGVVEDGVKVLSNIIASSADMHALTGGVVPEVAAREHLRQILPVIDQALRDAHTAWDDIDLIAVTAGPGLISSLLVGVNTAATLAYIHKKPLLPVQHILGHIYANFLDDGAPVQFPFVVLTVSGGHNELILMRDHFEFEVLGETLDDAAGEAFDKVARLLGLGYPGGPVISKAAEKGDSKAFKFPRSFLSEDHRFDFSFSGLKAAVARQVSVSAETRHGASLQKQKPDALTPQCTSDLAASFQQAVVDVLSTKLINAVEETGVRIVHLAGGVSANRLLRETITQKLPTGVSFYCPKNLRYCTDNGAMIAGAAYFLNQKTPASLDGWKTIKADANWWR